MKKKVLIILLLITMIVPFNVYAEGECCINNNGLYRCGDEGYYVCNDGTTSTCECVKPTTKRKDKVTNKVKSSSYDQEDLMYTVMGVFIFYIFLCMITKK